MADKLWRNESEEIKNEYKQLAKTMKCCEQSFKTETIDNVENSISLGTTSDYPSTNTEPNLYGQFLANTLNINLPPITDDTSTISVQTSNLQN
ncbi:24062_t:CDS:1, partial [Racocetra persica]